MATLVITDGLGRGQRFRLNGAASILGRSSSCDIVLPGTMISREHCLVERKNGSYFVRDLGSRNGTLVDGEPTSGSTPLNNGSTLQFDEMVLEFQLNESPVPLLDESSSNLLARVDKESHVVATLQAGANLRVEQNAEAKLRAVLQLGERVGLSLEMETVATRVLESSLSIFPRADRASVILTRDGGNVIPFAIRTRAEPDSEPITIGPISRTIARRVLAEGIAILSTDVLADKRFEQSQSIFEMGIQSMMCAPLTGADQEPFGLLTIDQQSFGDPFTENDLDLLVSLSGVAAQSLAFAQLHQQLISERKRAEAELKRANQALFAVVQSSPLPIFVINSKGKVSQVWNPAAEITFGWTKEEILQQALPIIPADEIERFERYCKDRWRGQPSKRMEISCTNQAGDKLDVELSAAPLRGKDGRISNLMFIAADMTELKAARHRLMQQERLAVIGEMMTAVSHESRNALHRIRLGIDLLSRMTADQAETADVLKHLHEAESELFRLFEDVRSYAAPMQLDRKPVKMLDLVRDVWHKLEPTRADRDAELNIHPDAANAACQADANRLAQVFRNLMENSLAAGDDPVRIEVHCEKIEAASEARLQITHRDNGPGLSDEQHRRIFEPFFTTKEKGTGIGMAISQRIVAAHGGTIHSVIESTDGAEFVIELPMQTSGKSV